MVAGEDAGVLAPELGLLEGGRRDRETVSHGRERRLQRPQFGNHRLRTTGRDVGGQRQRLRLVDRVRGILPENRTELEESGATLVLTSVQCQRLEQRSEEHTSELQS